MSTTIIPFEMEYKEYFYTFMIESFKKNAEKLKEVIINSMKLKNYNKHYTITGLYNMSFYVNYDELLEKLKNTAKKYDTILV
jgi:hypothetical protein